MFRDADGPLYEFLKEIGRDMSDCGGNDAQQAFVSNLQPSRRTLVRARTGGILAMPWTSRT